MSCFKIWILTLTQFYGSDVECYVHVFTIPGSENSYLLCFALILLQQHNSTLPDMLLWLPKKHHSARKLRRLCSPTTALSWFFYVLEVFLLTQFFPSLLSLCSPKSPHLASKHGYAPLVKCTSHMCPIRVHWHVKLNYKDYWWVKVTITNFNYNMNYTQWNLVVQHPNFDNLTRVSGFNYKRLTPYADISESHFKI